MCDGGRKREGTSETVRKGLRKGCTETLRNYTHALLLDGTDCKPQ